MRCILCTYRSLATITQSIAINSISGQFRSNRFEQPLSATPTAVITQLMFNISRLMVAVTGTYYPISIHTVSLVRAEYSIVSYSIVPFLPVLHYVRTISYSHRLRRRCVLSLGTNVKSALLYRGCVVYCLSYLCAIRWSVSRFASVNQFKSFCG